jgi:hypothetical protein
MGAEFEIESSTAEDAPSVTSVLAVSYPKLMASGYELLVAAQGGG